MSILPARLRRTVRNALAGRWSPTGWIVVAVAVPLLLAAPVAAQEPLADEGTFLLRRDGEVVGTERFTIRRTRRRDEVRLIVTGEVELRLPTGTRRIRPALEVAGPQMRVTAYQVRVSGDEQSDIYLSLADRRFQAKVVTPRGEELREFRSVPAAIVLDREIAHQFFLVAARLGSAGSGTVPVIAPRSGEQFDLSVNAAGTERIEVGGTTVEARRLDLESSRLGGSVWVDAANRVLRVVNRSDGLVAEREELPE